MIFEFGGIDYKKLESNTNADLCFGKTNHNSIYNYSTIYEQYLMSKIDNEEKIISHLKSIIPVKESAYKNLRSLHESTLGDKAKNRFNKIIAFIKNLLAKFMESISSFLLDNKDYLDKYKDIILKKQPKSDNKYSYTGNYQVAVQRCMNYQPQIFNFNTYSSLLDKDDAEEVRVEIVKKLFVNQEGFSYANGDNLKDQCKEYFLAWDKGETEGTFDDGKLNFTDMYNFCYNVGQITKIKTRDEKYVEDANKKIMTEIETAIKKDTKPNGDAKPDENQSTVRHNSFISVLDNYRSIYLMEDEANPEGNSDKPQENTDTGENSSTPSRDANNTGGDGDKPSGSNTLKISTANNAITAINNDKQNSISSDDAKKSAEGVDSSMELSKVQTLGDRYLQVVRTIIAARCTALEQIAKNYMEIIRAHVRSYVGNESDESTNKTKQAGNTFSRDKQSQSSTNT